jgi:putative spermidine/putrescine transport system permease protein
LAFFCAFWLLPLTRLFIVSGGSQGNLDAYFAILISPHYLQSLVLTVGISLAVTATALVLATTSGLFLARAEFRFKSVLTALMTFPMAFPGVVVGFLVILLAGRQGLIATVSGALFDTPIVFAYSLLGLFTGYLYFSIPRVILTVMAAAEKLDPELVDAARSLGASRRQVLTDVLLPGLSPALIGAAALSFATSMGAFGTAFTLATKIDVLPIAIYNEFTNYANFATAAALSILLGAVTWVALAVARHWAGATGAAGA